MFLNVIVKNPRSGYLAFRILGKGNKDLESGVLTLRNKRYRLVKVHILDLELVFILPS